MNINHSVGQRVAFSLALALSASIVAPEAAPAKAPKAAAATNQSSAQSLTTGTALKSVRDVSRRLRAAALDVINDVEQRDMVVTGEPMIIQPIPMKDDNKPVGWAQEMEDLGPALPPKKTWLDMDIANIGDLVGLLVADVGAVATPTDTGLADPWSNVKAVVQDIQDHYKALKDLSKGPKYDNLAIGKQALVIYDDVARLEKPWKAAVHATRSGK